MDGPSLANLSLTGEGTGAKVTDFTAGSAAASSFEDGFSSLTAAAGDAELPSVDGAASVTTDWLAGFSSRGADMGTGLEEAAPSLLFDELVVPIASNCFRMMITYRYLVEDPSVSGVQAIF
jgi:hypothetical protein